MNPEPLSETEAIRSDIEMTRRRMDDTVEALGERLRGRHLVDELIGFFRGGEDGSGTGAQVREKISQAAGTASSAVANTLKQNPLPILLITAGAAWLAYSASRGRSSHVESSMDEIDPYDPDMHYDRPLEYPGTPSTMSAGSAVGESVAGYESGSKFSDMKDSLSDKASQAKQQIQGKLSDISNTTRDKMQAMRGRASEIGSRVKGRASEFGTQVQDRTRQAYTATRQRVATTADQHPLEVGLGCLALGIVAGLAIPTPPPVNRLAGPTVDRLRSRTREAGREMLEKGRRVAQAASDAVREEAQSQGLTVDRLKSSAAAVGQRAESAIREAAHEQAGNLAPENQNQTNRVGTEPADPSAARPAM